MSKLLLFILFPACGLYAAEIRISYPYEGMALPNVPKTFIFGNITPSTAPFYINGSKIEVYADTQPLDDLKKGIDVGIADEKSIATVKEGRLYNLVDYEYGPGLLEMRIKGGGFRINTFTFG